MRFPPTTTIVLLFHSQLILGIELFSHFKRWTIRVIFRRLSINFCFLSASPVLWLLCFFLLEMVLISWLNNNNNRYEFIIYYVKKKWWKGMLGFFAIWIIKVILKWLDTCVFVRGSCLWFDDKQLYCMLDDAHCYIQSRERWDVDCIPPPYPSYWPIGSKLMGDCFFRRGYNIYTSAGTHQYSQSVFLCLIQHSNTTNPLKHSAILISTIVYTHPRSNVLSKSFRTRFNPILAWFNAGLTLIMNGSIPNWRSVMSSNHKWDILGILIHIPKMTLQTGAVFSQKNSISWNRS